MNTTWCLVADSSRARIYEWQRKSGRFDEIRDLIHSQSRRRPTALTSDVPGRSFSSVGESRHAMEQPTDPKRHEAELFAAELAGHLERARAEGRFAALVLVAPPRFLGLLRGRLSDATLSVVSGEVRKNLTRENTEGLKRAIIEQR